MGMLLTSNAIVALNNGDVELRPVLQVCVNVIVFRKEIFNFLRMYLNSSGREFCAVRVLWLVEGFCGG